MYSRLIRCVLTCLAFAAMSQKCEPAKGETVSASFIFHQLDSLERAGQRPSSSDPSVIVDYRTAQTFLPTVSGTAATVKLAAVRWNASNAPLRVDIASTTNAGLPGSIFATVYVPPEDLPNRSQFTLYEPVIVDFSSAGVFLQAGTLYAIELSTDSPTGDYNVNSQRTRTSGFTPLSYPPGILYSSLDGSAWTASPKDLYFEVTVNPVPEPSTYALTAIGVVAILLARRRSEV